MCNDYPSTPYPDPAFEKARKTYLSLGLNISETQKPETWVHSLKCTKRLQETLDAINAYNHQWPNACPTCDGWGIINDTQSVPYGMGSTLMPVDDICETCLENGACPRCGEMILATDDQFQDFVENEELCPFCGWAWGRNAGDTRPPEPECYCWQ